MADEPEQIPCLDCGTLTDNRWAPTVCGDCWTKRIHAEKQIRSALLEAYPVLHGRAVHAITRTLITRSYEPVRDPTAGGIVARIAEMTDSEMDRWEMVGEKTIRQIRAAIPSRTVSERTCCPFCGHALGDA